MIQGKKYNRIVKHVTSNFASVFLIQWDSSEVQANQRTTFKTKQNPTELPYNQCEIHRFREKKNQENLLYYFLLP